MGEKRNAYRVLVGKPEGKRLLGIPRRRWERIILPSVLVIIGGILIGNWFYCTLTDS
jgi:hypothetical protein